MNKQVAMVVICILACFFVINVSAMADSSSFLVVIEGESDWQTKKALWIECTNRLSQAGLFVLRPNEPVLSLDYADRLNLGENLIVYLNIKEFSHKETRHNYNFSLVNTDSLEYIIYTKLQIQVLQQIGRSRSIVFPQAGDEPVITSEIKERYNQTNINGLVAGGSGAQWQRLRTLLFEDIASQLANRVKNVRSKQFQIINYSQQNSQPQHNSQKVIFTKGRTAIAQGEQKGDKIVVTSGSISGGYDSIFTFSGNIKERNYHEIRIFGEGDARPQIKKTYFVVKGREVIGEIFVNSFSGNRADCSIAWSIHRNFFGDRAILKNY